MTEITLKHPVTFNGAEVKMLNLRRPKGRDLKKMDAGKGSALVKSFALIADLAGVDPNMIDELDPEDLAQVNDWLGPILDPKGERSGEASN